MTSYGMFSYGVFLWELLTGQVPYDKFDNMQVMFGVATHKIFLHIPASCPDELRDILQCLYFLVFLSVFLEFFVGC